MPFNDLITTRGLSKTAILSVLEATIQSAHLGSPASAWVTVTPTGDKAYAYFEIDKRLFRIVNGTKTVFDVSSDVEVISSITTTTEPPEEEPASVEYALHGNGILISGTAEVTLHVQYYGGIRNNVLKESYLNMIAHVLAEDTQSIFSALRVLSADTTSDISQNKNTARVVRVPKGSKVAAWQL